VNSGFLERFESGGLGVRESRFGATLGKSPASATSLDQ
jgi:hypothetical protein